MTEQMMVDPSAYADVEGLFEDRPKGAGTFLSIFQHGICQRSKSYDTEEEALSNLTAMLVNDDGWAGPHKTTNPNTKQDRYSLAKRYDRMVARIADISKDTKEFDASKGGGKVTNWNIIMLSGGKRLTLQLTWCDPVLKRFLKVAPNIDYTRPLLISAFSSMRNGEAKQAVSFRQYQEDMADLAAFRDVDKWTKVNEYWQADKRGPDGKALEGSKSVGLDGTILPHPEYDEEDKSWDYRAQNKFLAMYFRDNILPTIKALAEQYGLDNPDTDTSTPTHTGPTVDDTPVTIKPANPVAMSMNELATGGHIALFRRLAEAQNFEPDYACQKLTGVGINELSDEAVRYAIYKLQTRAAKKAETVGVAPATPIPAPTPVVTPPPAQFVMDPADPADDIDWDAAPAPAVATGASAFQQAVNPVTPTKEYDPNSNDDVEW